MAASPAPKDGGISGPAAVVLDSEVKEAKK